MAHEQENWLGIDWDSLPLPTLYSTYMWVWAALLILTIVEVIVPDPHILHTWGILSVSGADAVAGFLPRTAVVLSLILLALAKTFFVAWYYMHLIDERPSIILIACAPFIFSVFLTIGLWPHTPPHSAIKGKAETDKKSTGEQAQLEEAESPQKPSNKVTLSQGMKLAEETLAPSE